jgi:hypothetical protein
VPLITVTANSVAQVLAAWILRSWVWIPRKSWISIVRLSVLSCTVSRLRRSLCVCVCVCVCFQEYREQKKTEKSEERKKGRKKCLALLVFGRSRVQTSSSRPTSVVFLSPFRQLLGYYLQLRHNRFHLQTFRLVIIYLIQRCSLRYLQCHQINHKWLKYKGTQNANSQGRIKGFVGPRHFLSLGPFGDSKSIVGTTVYSRLSEPMGGEELHR